MNKHHYLVAAICLVFAAGMVTASSLTAAGSQSSTPASGTPAAAGDTAVEGLITVESSRSVQETMDRLETALEENDLIVVARIDHAANAENAGLELPPTQLIIFGNPQLGTPLMQSERTVGIDLPQKFLVWEDADGTVYVGYNDPVYLAERHGISGQDDVIQQVSQALAMLAETATAP
ncbi:MAG: DUF302 domain-containing protein [Thermomicrobiales bacterium]